MRIIYVMLLVMTFSIIGCDTQTDGTNVPEQDIPQETEQNTNEETEQSTGQETEKSTAQDVEANYDEFVNTLQDNPEYEVKYELTYSSGKEQTVVIYTKDGNTRMDLPGEDVTAWMNGKSIVDYQGQCLDLSAIGGRGFDPESIYQMTTVKEGTINTEEEYLDISEAGTKSIAGKTTTCYEFLYETDAYNQLTTYCLTEEGIPALVRTVNKDTDELQSETKATRLKNSVSDDVLEPCEPTGGIEGFR
ncbi:MAG: hypothetical protein ACQESG_08465 [Nanobdellota archaeon]